MVSGGPMCVDLDMGRLLCVILPNLNLTFKNFPAYQ